MSKTRSAQQTILLAKKSKGIVDNQDVENAIEMHQLSDKQADELFVWIIQNDLAIETRLNDWRTLNTYDRYFQDIARYPLLTAEQERELAVKMKQGDKLAKDRFIKSNLRLVVAIARQYQGKLALNDLIQEGNIGLVKAVDRFDPDKNVPFASYGQYWIRQAISRAISQNHVIHLPVNLSDTLKKIRKIERELEQKLERQPSNLEIAEMMELTEKEVKEIREFNFDAISIDKNLDDSVTISLEDLLISSSDTGKYIDHKILSEEIRAALSKLSPRDAEIVRMRYGINYSHGMTLQQIARHYGLSKERVRQIIDAALSSLKAASVNLIDFMED